MATGAHTILPLRVEDLCFAARGLELIRNLSFTLDAGPSTAIVGANGAGKSLLLRLCHGLIAPTAGRISWDGAVNGNPGRHQAMVFQRPVMLRRTAAQNIDHALRLRSVPRASTPTPIPGSGIGRSGPA